MELSPDGSDYQLQSRLLRFVAVPKLMQQFRQLSDAQTTDLHKLRAPKLE